MAFETGDVTMRGEMTVTVTLTDPGEGTTQWSGSSMK
jgi:hypothetical protein